MVALIDFPNRKQKKMNMVLVGAAEEDPELMAVLGFLLWQGVPHKIKIDEKAARLPGLARTTAVLMDGHAVLARGFLQIVEWFKERDLIREAGS